MDYFREDFDTVEVRSSSLLVPTIFFQPLGGNPPSASWVQKGTKGYKPDCWTDAQLRPNGKYEANDRNLATPSHLLSPSHPCPLRQPAFSARHVLRDRACSPSPITRRDDSENLGDRSGIRMTIANSGYSQPQPAPPMAIRGKLRSLEIVPIDICYWSSADDLHVCVSCSPD